MNNFRENTAQAVNAAGCSYAQLLNYNAGSPGMSPPVPPTTVSGYQIVPTWAYPPEYDTLIKGNNCSGFATIISAYGENADNCNTQFVQQSCMTMAQPDVPNGGDVPEGVVTEGFRPPARPTIKKFHPAVQKSSVGKMVRVKEGYKDRTDIVPGARIEVVSHPSGRTRIIEVPADWTGSPEDWKKFEGYKAPTASYKQKYLEKRAPAMTRNVVVPGSQLEIPTHPSGRPRVINVPTDWKGAESYRHPASFQRSGCGSGGCR
jgi:hypothetical protein